tara:strand:+ start:856 stop:1089 length:234 start_codon:yes stop_codon:yes gene_type:complete
LHYQSAISHAVLTSLFQIVPYVTVSEEIRNIKRRERDITIVYDMKGRNERKKNICGKSFRFSRIKTRYNSSSVDFGQ